MFYELLVVPYSENCSLTSSIVSSRRWFVFFFF